MNDQVGVYLRNETEFGFSEFGYVGYYEVYIVEGKGVGGERCEGSVGIEF